MPLRSDLQDYITKHYTAGNIVIAAAGGIEHAELVKLAERWGALSVHDLLNKAILVTQLGCEVSMI